MEIHRNGHSHDVSTTNYLNELAHEIILKILSFFIKTKKAFLGWKSRGSEWKLHYSISTENVALLK